jgi:hypothetical protein
MDQSQVATHRRLWLAFVPAALLVLLAASWSAFWFYASSRAEQSIAGWREREATSGRIHGCAKQSVAGFPFRIEVRCSDATAEFTTLQPPVVLKAKEILVTAQVYDPTLLISEITGPLTFEETGQPPQLVADWKLAQVSVRGTPATPERVSIAIDEPRVERVAGGPTGTLFTANRSELHGRIVAGTVNDNPLIELVLRLGAATAPTVHPALAQPLDGEITAVLRGLKDFAPKPWADRMREVQAADGRIDLVRARAQQGDIVAVGAGTLGLTPRGGLDGQIRLTVVGIEQLVQVLGLDRLVAQLAQPRGNNDRADRPARGLSQLSPALDSLDRIVPGLGGAIRERYGPNLAAAGIALLGQPAELEGKKAVALPLRFSDGAVSLGPLPIGQTPPLF